MVWYLVFLAFGCSTLYLCRKTDEESLKKYNRCAVNATFFGVMVILIMAFMAGFRDKIGTDYKNYVEIYESLTWSKVNIESNIEIGYSFLNMLVKSIVDYYPLLFTLVAFIMYFPIYLACRKESAYIELSLFLFVCFGLYINSFNIMRQYMAAGIIFYAWQIVYKRKFLRYCLYIALAMLFHISAIIMIPCYFVVVGIKGKHADLFRLLIAVCAIIIALNISDVYAIIYRILPQGSKYKEYFNPSTINLNDARGLTYPLFCIIVYVMYRIVRKKEGKNPKIEQQVNILTIGFFFSAIGQRVEIILRFQIFFVPIMIVMIPNLISRFKNRDMWYLLVVIAGTAFFLITSNAPYHSILLGGTI